MPKQFDHPLLKKGENETLRFKNLEAAKEAFFKVFDQVEDVFKKDPNAKMINPIFGLLDKADWKLLNQKHLFHHLTQFGLEKSTHKKEVYD